MGKECSITYNIGGEVIYISTVIFLDLYPLLMYKLGYVQAWMSTNASCNSINIYALLVTSMHVHIPLMYTYPLQCCATAPLTCLISMYIYKFNNDIYARLTLTNSILKQLTHRRTFVHCCLLALSMCCYTHTQTHTFLSFLLLLSFHEEWCRPGSL